jgi:hypothetical protein
LQGAAVGSAIAFLQHGTGDQLAIRKELNVLTEQLDNQYLVLSEEPESISAESLAWFRKARAASALSFVLSDDAAGLQETIYEAINATSDPAATIALAEPALVTA